MTNVPNWIIWASYLGGAAIFLGIAFRVVRAFVRAFAKIDSLVKVIDPVIQMANDFKENGGSTLKDAVNRIDVAARTAVEVSDQARGEVVRLAEVVGTVALASDSNNRLLHELKGVLTATPSAITAVVTTTPPRSPRATDPGQPPPA